MIIPKEHQKEFAIYASFLIEENKKYNLTAISSIEEINYKHFIDSIMIQEVIKMEDIKNICDVGSGAGFPGIPLKIIYPHLSLTIIEPTLKRCQFLEQLVHKLKLDNVTIINDRAENKKDLRESFDVVCARAVASLPILLELCIPLLKKDGYFIAMKGSNYQEECEQAKNALKTLDCVIDNVYLYDLASENISYGIHSLLRIKKNQVTKNIYPRNYAAIKKKPL